MALSIENPEIERIARELSKVTGETVTEVIIQALKERLERKIGQPKGKQLREEIERIQNRIGRLSRLDDRSDEEILGYKDEEYPV